MSNTCEMLFSQCLVRSCRRRVQARARARGPDKGCDGCVCARARACEYVRNGGEGARRAYLDYSVFPFHKKNKKKNKKQRQTENSSGGGGVNVQARRGVTAEGSVFWVGVWGRKTHDFKMLTLSLQVVACREATICDSPCKGVCWHLILPYRKASGD